MPRLLGADLREFLEQPIAGVIATLRADGRPYTVPVWWLFDGEVDDDAHSVKNPPRGDFWLTGTLTRVWCKQLQHDPRASLCIETTTPASRHVGVDGICEALMLPDFDIWPTSRRLAEKYVGLGDPTNADAVEAFFANMQTEPRMLFRLKPEVWRAIDLTVYRGKREDREFQAAQARPDA